LLTRDSGRGLFLLPMCRQLLDGLVAGDFDEQLRAIRGGGGGRAGGQPLGVVVKSAQVRLMTKPLEEDLEDPWERQRWWESNVGREPRLLKLMAGTDTLEWCAISSGER
jgi:hypothetical protein